MQTWGLVSSQPVAVVTGRNEVLAKVIFSQVCVILSTGGVPAWSRGVSEIFRGGLKFWGRCEIFGVGCLKF